MQKYCWGCCIVCLQCLWSYQISSAKNTSLYAYIVASHSFAGVCRFVTCFVTVFATVIAITKDLPDVEGDRKYNIDTLATRLGVRTISFAGKCTVAVTILTFTSTHDASGQVIVMHGQMVCAIQTHSVLGHLTTYCKQASMLLHLPEA